MKYIKNSFTKNKIILLLIITLLIFISSTIILHNRYNKLKNQTLDHINNEWYQLNRMCEIIDKNYINSNSKEAALYRMFVNQLCYNFTPTVITDDLSVNMNRLLIEAYDPLFKNLSYEDEVIDTDEALKLLKEMNNFLYSISHKIVTSENIEWLIKESSKEHIDLNENVENFTIEYIQLVDDYFKQDTSIN
ncbi:hypothetical protein SH1V18_44530 [Vallitalea longa]|uniref:Uncharacterized protein n=1 Tax=Vallitalea longa TaxID=2936439 RepID=A0A9W5YGQ0_9FIRM|nr:hypothetical protein [Vallitalea longa]GKX31973.1 hypothetical protein SH1V18_44530 [Vallitalea longa]